MNRSSRRFAQRVSRSNDFLLPRELVEPVSIDLSKPFIRFFGDCIAVLFVVGSGTEADAIRGSFRLPGNLLWDASQFFV